MRGNSGGGSSSGSSSNSSNSSKRKQYNRTKSELKMGLDFDDLDSGEALYDPNRPADDAIPVSQVRGGRVVARKPHSLCVGAQRDRGMSVAPFSAAHDAPSARVAPGEYASVRPLSPAPPCTCGCCVPDALTFRTAGAALPFACDICGKSYAVVSDVMFHKTKRHAAELAAAKRAEADKRADEERRREQQAADERRRALDEKAAERRRAALIEQRIAEAQREQREKEQRERAKPPTEASGESDLDAVMAMLGGADDEPSVDTGNSSVSNSTTAAQHTDEDDEAPPADPTERAPASTDNSSGSSIVSSAAAAAKERAAAAKAALAAAEAEAAALEAEALRLEREESEAKAKAEREAAEAKARQEREAREAQERADREMRELAMRQRQEQVDSIRRRAKELLSDCGSDKALLAIVVEEAKACMLKQREQK